MPRKAVSAPLSGDAVQQANTRAELLSQARDARLATVDLPDRAPRLVPGPALVACSGSDVTRSAAARKGRVLISFPGLMLPCKAGTIGELRGLNSAEPRMVIKQPGGVLELQGALVRPSSKILSLSCDASKRAIACNDVFSAMIAFTKAVWKPGRGDAEEDDEALIQEDTAAAAAAAAAAEPPAPTRKPTSAACAPDGHVGAGRPATAEEAAAAGYDGASTIAWFDARRLATPSSSEAAAGSLLELFGPLGGSDGRPTAGGDGSGVLDPLLDMVPTASSFAGSSSRSNKLKRSRPQPTNDEEDDEDDEEEDEVLVLDDEEEEEEEEEDEDENEDENEEEEDADSDSSPARRKVSSSSSTRKRSRLRRESRSSSSDEDSDVSFDDSDE